MRLSENGKRLLQVENSDINLDGSFVIPNDVTEIGEAAFESCEKLKALFITDKVTKISQRTFGFCKNLKDFAFPTGITQISRGTFFQCSSLESLIIPSGVKVIDVVAFSQCINLETITLPESIEAIKDKAFEGCIKLNHIIIDSEDVEEIARITNLLSDNLKKAVIPRVLVTKASQTFKAQLTKLISTPQVNPLFRFFNYVDNTSSVSVANNTQREKREIEKECGYLPQDILGYMNQFLKHDNLYYQKAKNLMLQEPLPHDEEQLEAYKTALEKIVDECIARAKEFTQPVSSTSANLAISESNLLNSNNLDKNVDSKPTILSDMLDNKNAKELSDTDTMDLESDLVHEAQVDATQKVTKKRTISLTVNTVIDESQDSVNRPEKIQKTRSKVEHRLFVVSPDNEETHSDKQDDTPQNKT